MDIDRFWDLDIEEVLYLMEASQGRWDILDEYLAHFTAYIVRPHLKKNNKLKAEDLLKRPKEVSVPTMSERREFFEDYASKQRAPRRRK